MVSVTSTSITAKITILACLAATSPGQAEMSLQGHDSWHARPGAGFGQPNSSTASLRVYIYDLPARFQNLSMFSNAADAAEQYNTFLYGADKRVPEVLGASPYVTRDPAEAQLFLVPVWLYAIRVQPYLKLRGMSELMTPTRLAVNVVLNYIQSRYPYWDAHRGRDHVWILTQDHGFCGFDTNEGTHDEIAESIILSHWGLTTNEIDCSLQHRLRTFDHCQMREAAAAAAAKGQSVPLALPCFVPKKDVVIPSVAMDAVRFGEIPEAEPVLRSPDPAPLVAGSRGMGAGAGPAGDVHHHHRHSLHHPPAAAAEQAPAAPHERQRQPTPDVPRPMAAEQRRHLLAELPVLPLISPVKQHTLVFVGGTSFGSPDYSHGVRQTVINLFHSTPGFFMRDTANASNRMAPDTINMEMGRSHFCLAPSGAGWGVRLKQAIMLGCVPVVIQDNVKVPYEDVLPYRDFAVRLPQHMIYHLPEILGQMLPAGPEYQLAVQMRARLPCAARYFSWAQGGRAVDALACALVMRVHGAEVIPRMDWEKCELDCPPPPQ